MSIFDKTVYQLNSYLLKIALYLSLLMMFFTVGDVLGRLLFKPVPGIFELTRYSLALIVFTSLGWSQIHKVHIAIDLFVSRLPILWQNIIDVFNYFLASITFFLAFWQMSAYTGRLIETSVITSVLRIHIFPFVLVSAIGVLFFTLALFSDFLHAVKKLLKGVENDERVANWNS